MKFSIFFPFTHKFNLEFEVVRKHWMRINILVVGFKLYVVYTITKICLSDRTTAIVIIFTILLFII